jgi:long-chain acyl-CoA synthetase
LKGFEQARNIHLESSPFLNRGILTNTMKIQRHQAKKTYKDVIEKLYKEK